MPNPACSLRNTLVVQKEEIIAKCVFVCTLFCCVETKHMRCQINESCAVCKILGNLFVEDFRDLSILTVWQYVNNM